MVFGIRSLAINGNASWGLLKHAFFNHDDPHAIWVNSFNKVWERQKSTLHCCIAPVQFNINSWTISIQLVQMQPVFLSSNALAADFEILLEPLGLGNTSKCPHGREAEVIFLLLFLAPFFLNAQTTLTTPLDASGTWHQMKGACSESCERIHICNERTDIPGTNDKMNTLHTHTLTRCK